MVGHRVCMSVTSFSGLMQNYARKHSIPIDMVDYDFEMLSNDPEQYKTPPEEGVYVHGLFLEGCRWDAQQQELVESNPKARIPSRIQTFQPRFRHIIPGSLAFKCSLECKILVLVFTPVQELVHTSQRSIDVSKTGFRPTRIHILVIHEIHALSLFHIHWISLAILQVLFVQAPCMWLRPRRVDQMPKYPHYNCPVYRTLERRGVLATTGHSTNFVMYVRLPTSKDPSHWIMRSVALITALSD